ncbi:MAG: hypothetical protein P8074_27835 [Anaerolineales bacterium]
MKTSHILYHLIRADFWERVRRNSFLIAIGATILLGYLFVPPQDARYLAGVLPHFTSDSGATQYLRGVYNSAWIGSMVALMTALLLSLPGFYLVKNCIERDARTGVGEIIAATPLSRPVYVLGKWLSNLAVLTFLILILALTALVMQLVRGEVLEIELWKLLSPFLAMAFPVAALVAALAVFFEAFTLLRGGLGNVVYFFLWTVGVIVVFENDLFGWELLFSSVQAAAQTSFPAVINASIGINPIQGPLQTFIWEGVSWTAAYVYRQALWVSFALGIVLVAALIFSRFDPAPEGILKTRPTFGAIQRRLFSRRMPPEPVDGVLKPVLESNFLAPVPELTQPTGLALRAGRFRFWRTFLAELRLALKGQRWWWYLVAGGLWAASLLAPLEDARGGACLQHTPPNSSPASGGLAGQSESDAFDGQRDGAALHWERRWSESPGLGRRGALHPFPGGWAGMLEWKQQAVRGGVHDNLVSGTGQQAIVPGFYGSMAGSRSGGLFLRLLFGGTLTDRVCYCG